MKNVFIIALTLCFLPSIVFGYTYHKKTSGVLTVEIPKPDPITQIDTEYKIPVLLENKGETELSLKLSTWSIEKLEPLESTVSVKVSAKSKEEVFLKYIARKGTYTAHYPIFLETECEIDCKIETISVVQPIETKFDPVYEEKMFELPTGGALKLAELRNYKVFWNQDKTPGVENELPIGWRGSEPNSMTSLSVHNVDRGGLRNSFAVHPPYRGGAGNTAIEYRIKLPDERPIKLFFENAIRDVFPPEPPSDGVTFRVDIDAKKAYEKHSKSTSWEPNELDLSEYAGKEISLALVTDPGPKRDTTCDACFWGNVFLLAGEKPVFLDENSKKALLIENLAAVKSGKSSSENSKIYKLDSGLNIVLTPGLYGLADGVIGFGDKESQVQYDGLRVSVDGESLGHSPSMIRAGKCIWNEKQNSWELPIQSGTKKFKLLFRMKEEKDALRIAVETEKPDDDISITEIAFGPASKHAPRVYFGHGFCVSEPKRFSVSNGGHVLSTSHVGFDFENGLSLLMASTFPPDRLEVDPDRKTYTLSVHPSTQFTLLPGRNGAMDCAIRYRPLYDKKPAPGVTEKAGKLVVDIWGNRYSNDAETIRKLSKYGIKDLIYLVHVWQRYGYDNRLPDIWPPDEKFGTLEDMKDAIKAADDAGFLYALHDNYIDFYPDAEGFNFDHIVFTKEGVPVKAWNNYGVDAQSYRFRPDKILPFLNRNFDMMLKDVAPSSYFVDVFASIDLFDYYDRNGKFHSRKETLEYWNKAFDTIRKRLAEKHPKIKHPPTISEAGDDFLIGHLDGSDCQFMFISTEPGEHRMNIPCEDWARVPWFDLVNHTRFSLHGAGYSGRYEAARGRPLHGIESDDYITAEILTGHAMMTDNGSKLRGTVRKAWLAQDFINAVKDKEIEEIEFVDGDIHRLEIKWSNGAIVCVNRGKTDWNIDTYFEMRKIIPPMGFLAMFNDGNSYCGILRDPASLKVMEIADKYIHEKDGFITYFNPRQVTTASVTPVKPGLKSLEFSGDGRVKLDILWDVRGKVPFDYNTFVHIGERKLWWAHKTNWGVLGGGFCEKPCSTWKAGDSIVQPMGTMRIPDDLPAGMYDLLVGLYHSRGDGHRAMLMGQEDGSRRYSLGQISFQRNSEGKVVNPHFEAAAENDEDAHLYDRLVPLETTMTPGEIRAGGAFLMSEDKQSFTITPLPDEPAFEISIRDRDIPEKCEITALDENGKVLRNVEFERVEIEGKKHVKFKTDAKDFQYKITK